MKKEEVTLKVFGILVEKLKITEDINENTALISEKLLDSLEFMNYITIVEDDFQVSISDEDIEQYQLGIVKNMIDYLSR